MTGLCPSFFLLACFFQDIQKRFVFFAALRTHIEVFTYEGHQLRRVLFVDFHLDVFVDSCIYLITGSILFPYAFEHAQEAQHSLVGGLCLMRVETAFNLLDNGSDVHTLCL